MGATSKMYQKEWLDHSDFTFLDWPLEFIPKDIIELSVLIADKIDNQTSTIVGSSMGGMVALEIAKIKNIKNVVLIGSALSSKEINNVLKSLSHITDYLPLNLLKKLSGKIPLQLSQMYSEQSSEFIRNMIKSVMNWESTTTCNLLRIHGKKDHIIKAEYSDLWIDGGHLLALTHPKECIDAIKNKFS